MNTEHDVLGEYHRRTRIQHFMIGFSRTPYFVKRHMNIPFGNARRHIWLRRNLRVARDVYFQGTHVNTPSATWEDVSISFDGKKADYYAFMLTSLKDIEDQAQFSWEQGELPSSGNAQLVPEDYLTPENMHEACEHWYADQVRWWHGHFSHKEGMPRIHTDFKFSDNEEGFDNTFSKAIRDDLFANEPEKTERLPGNA